MKRKIKDLKELLNPSVETILIVSKIDNQEIRINKGDILSQPTIDTLKDWLNPDWNWFIEIN